MRDNVNQNQNQSEGRNERSEVMPLVSVPGKDYLIAYYDEEEREREEEERKLASLVSVYSADLARKGRMMSAKANNANDSKPEKEDTFDPEEFKKHSLVIKYAKANKHMLNAGIRGDDYLNKPKYQVTDYYEFVKFKSEFFDKHGDIPFGHHYTPLFIKDLITLEHELGYWYRDDSRKIVLKIFRNPLKFSYVQSLIDKGCVEHFKAYKYIQVNITNGRLFYQNRENFQGQNDLAIEYFYNHKSDIELTMVEAEIEVAKREGVKRFTSLNIKEDNKPSIHAKLKGGPEEIGRLIDQNRIRTVSYELVEDDTLSRDDLEHATAKGYGVESKINLYHNCKTIKPVAHDDLVLQPIHGLSDKIKSSVTFSTEEKGVYIEKTILFRFENTMECMNKVIEIVNGIDNKYHTDFKYLKEDIKEYNLKILESLRGQLASIVREIKDRVVNCNKASVRNVIAKLYFFVTEEDILLKIDQNSNYICPYTHYKILPSGQAYKDNAEILKEEAIHHSAVVTFDLVSNREDLILHPSLTDPRSYQNHDPIDHVHLLPINDNKEKGMYINIRSKYKNLSYTSFIEESKLAEYQVADTKENILKASETKHKESQSESKVNQELMEQLVAENNRLSEAVANIKSELEAEREKHKLELEKLNLEKEKFEHTKSKDNKQIETDLYLAESKQRHEKELHESKQTYDRELHESKQQYEREVHESKQRHEKELNASKFDYEKALAEFKYENEREMTRSKYRHDIEVMEIKHDYDMEFKELEIEEKEKDRELSLVLTREKIQADLYKFDIDANLRKLVIEENCKKRKDELYIHLLKTKVGLIEPFLKPKTVEYKDNGSQTDRIDRSNKLLTAGLNGMKLIQMFP